MRALALLLILANLGFLGWSQLVDVRTSRSAYPERVGAASAPRLVLSAEAGNHPAASQPVDFAAPTAPAGVRPEETSPAFAATDDLRCVSVGTFRDLAEAVQASAVLQTGGYFSRQRVEQGDVWLGYWVSVQNLASREAAEQTLAALSQHGITDAYILPGSEPANILSLGVFNDTARAQRRVEEIRALGFEAQVADRKRTGSVYWIDVDLASPGQMFDPALLQTQQGKIVRLEFRPCPDGGSPAVDTDNPVAQAEG